MNLISKEINDYMVSLLPKRHPELIKMEEYANEHGFPIIGPLSGQFLQLLVQLTSAKRIFEMGSGYGYSSLWMSLILPDDGKIECTEYDQKNIELANSHHKKAGVFEKIIWHQGDALEAMEKAAGPYDIILCDIDKHDYPKALKLAWGKLRPGGVMVTDNSLWSGKVVSENPPVKSTAGVQQFNQDAFSLADAHCSIIPIRDGLLVAFKK